MRSGKGALTGAPSFVALAAVLLVLGASSLLLGGGLASTAGAQDPGDQTPDELVQRYAEQYGDLRCPDFENQQQAQAIFELDPIIFGDELDADVNGVACDEENFFASQEAGQGQQSQARNQSQPQGQAPSRENSRQGGQPTRELLEAGGSGTSGAVPRMPGGGCPKEFPFEGETGCHADGGGAGTAP